jgi:hypothetical protein
MISAEDIATELNCTGRKLRGFLRSDLPRPETDKHQRWFFNRIEADEVKRQFRTRFG